MSSLKEDQEECTACLPVFDEELSKEMDSSAVRKTYPRWHGTCALCGFKGIRYASYMHYLCGDW